MLSKSHYLKRYFSSITLKGDTNQALDLGKYAIDFLKNGKPSVQVTTRAKLLHTDSVLCGYAALSSKTNAASILKNEAVFVNRRGTKSVRPKFGYARVFGSTDSFLAEKAIMANVSAVTELNSNSVSFGNNQGIHGGFVQSDFSPIVIGAAQQNAPINGEKVTKGLVLLEEIQGRLCESFSFGNFKVDYTLYGGVASAIAYGALLGATPEQIESAIGMFLAYNIPFSVIRQGKQLSDMVGASSGIIAESAVNCVKRAVSGLSGPSNIFQNLRSILQDSNSAARESPFDITLAIEGNNFSLMRNHFRLGLYNMHAAGAIEGVLRLLKDNKFIVQDDPDCITSIKIIGYQEGLDIVGSEERKEPANRYSAVSSIYYLGKKALKIILLNSASGYPIAKSYNYA